MECTFRDEKFANIALEEADKSNMKYHQHGCVAVINGTIIAKGHNSDRCYSSDGFLDDTCSCHAEIDVLRKISRLDKKNASVWPKNKKSCFLSARKPLRCKKK